jgi:hypothetical protein
MVSPSLFIDTLPFRILKYHDLREEKWLLIDRGI